MLQRRSWPPTAEPRAALLMLDESSAGAEVGVIWDATWARLEQCNTCFEKSGRLPVHLGLDHARGALLTSDVLTTVSVTAVFPGRYSRAVAGTYTM